MAKSRTIEEKRKIKSLKYLVAGVLFICLLFISSSIIISYHAKPLEAYKIDSTNLIDDGSFESFAGKAGDCCNSNPNASRVYASQSTDAFDGQFSLNLTSENHCACISKPVKDFSNSSKYFVSFYYKGDKPRICGWTSGDNTCIPNNKLDLSIQWTPFYSIISFTNKSESSSIFLYADSSGTPVTNLYDALEVHKLIKISPDAVFYSYEKYVIKTEPSNNVKGEKLNEDGWYIVSGKPDITIQFPYTELIIIIVIIIIIARLVLKREKEEWENVK